MKQVIGDFSGLQYAIASTENLKVNPSLLDQWRDIILLNELLGNVQEFYAHIFRAVHWCLEVNFYLCQSRQSMHFDKTRNC